MYIFFLLNNYCVFFTKPAISITSLKPGIYKINTTEPILTSEQITTIPHAKPIIFAIVSKEVKLKNTCQYATCHNKIFFLASPKTLDNLTCNGYQNNYDVYGPNKAFCSGDKFIHKKSNNELKNILSYKTNQSFTINLPDKQFNFSLQSPKPYKDSLYLNKAISLYASPQRTANKQLLDKNSYVAVLKKDPDWYEVDYYNNNHQLQHGWINRDDLIQSEWIKQLDHTKEFDFESALYNEGDTDNLMMVRIIDHKNNKILQTIRDLPTDLINPNDSILDDGTMSMEHIVEIKDINLDQYPDIIINSATPSSQIHGPISIYLYTPKQHRFIVNDLLSFVDEFTIDPKHKTVDCVSWSGKTDRNEYKYKFINYKPVLIYSSESSWYFDHGEEKIGHLRNGKMHYKTIYTK